MYVIRDKIKYRAKVRTKSQSGNTGFTDGLPLAWRCSEACTFVFLTSYFINFKSFIFFRFTCGEPAEPSFLVGPLGLALHLLDKTEHVPPLKTVKSVQFWS